MIADFTIADESVDGVAVVVARGELDIHGAPRLSRELTGAGEGAEDGVILDLSEVAFLDSAILGVMLGAARRLEHRGRRLVIVADDPYIRRVIEVTGLHRLFDVVATRAEALGRL